jgi:glycosyltransferase involved in cell wall biosynthesis
MKTIIIIPAKNEAVKIGQVVSEVKGLGHDVLVVDDGSTDDTSKIARSSGATVLIHAINRGQGASLKTGMAYALNYGYEEAVFFDADGQMKAEEISLLVGKLDSNHEVILGSRFLGRTENMPKAKRITLKLALLFTRITTGLRLSDVHNGFQAWSISAWRKIDLTQDRQAYASEILQEIADKKLRYLEYPVTITYTDYSKKKGQSIWNAFNILWDLLVKKRFFD